MRRKMKRFLTSALAFTMAFTMAGSNVVAAGLEGRQSLQVTEETELAEEVATVENETPEEELNSEELTLPEATAPTSNPKEVVERAYLLFEDFENDFPDDWEQSSTTNEISWQILPDDYNFVPPWPVETDEHDIVYSSLYTDVRLSYGNLITREMNLSGADSATLSFRYRNPEAHDDYDIFNVFYAVGDSDHYEDLMDVLTPHDEWTQVTINIPESMCVQRVKFVFSVTMQWGWGVALDDISVETHVTPTNTYAEGFENGGALPQGWTFLDADGDNNNWYVVRPGAQQVHGGEYILASASYSWTQETPLTPDNWAITPAITLPQNAGLSFWIKATDVRYHNEKIGVYIGSAPTLESMVALDPEIISPTTYQQYAYDLSAYAGQTVYIGFRHYDVSDEFQINLDDVEIFINETYYSVTYDANGGSGSMTDGNAYVLGYNFCVPENTFTAPEGYFFTGWNDRRNGKGTTYLPGDRLNITDNITLYAQWHKNFESFDVDFEQGMPEYWTIETTAPDFTWTYYDDIISTHSDWGNDEAMLISPRLNLADLFIATLRFSYRNNGTAAYGGQDLNIYYHVGDGPWIPLDFEQEETNAQLITYEIQLPAYALKDNVQICFESIENGERDNALASASISGTKLYSELIEGFENGIPEDWTLIAHTNVQGYTWTTQAGDSNSSAPIAPHNGSANALAPYIGESGSASLITPYMNLSEMDFAAIEFWLLNRRWSSDIDTLGVYYRMYGEEDWQQLFYTDQNHETWTRVRMRLPEEILAGSFQIKFVSYVRHGFGIGLDDIHVFGMTSDQHFSVSYDANGGGGIMTDSNSYMFADDAVLMGNKFTPPEGYFFAGWNTKADGSGVTYFAGDLYVILDSVTLYAQWLRIQQGFDLDCEKDLPKGWMVESTTTGFNWKHVGTVMQTSSNGEDGESWLISPSVNLAQKDGAKLVFSLFGSGNTEFNMNETEFKVYYRVNGRDWEEIYFSRKYPLEPYEYMIDLPERALADDVQIGLRSVENGDRITRLSYVRLAGFLTVSELTEDFENGIPSNWTVIADEDKPLYTWKTISGDGNVNPPIAPHGGEANAMVLHTSSGCTSWLLTPYLSFSGELDVVLKFWFLNRAWSGDIDELVVYYRTMKDGDWQTLADETSAHETWTTKDFVIPKERTEYPIQIAFQAIDRYGFGVGLDDIRIFEFDSSIGYTVTYDANGGSGTMVDENTYTFMSEACVKKNTFTAPENKTFLCWNTEADGSGTDYHYNDLITMTGNVTLYAQWISYPDSFDVAFGLHLPENWSIETTNDAYMWFGEENDFAACSNGKEGTTWLISPYLDLSRGTSAVLSFMLSYCADFERSRNFSVCYRVSDGEWMDLGFTPKVEYNYVMYYDIYLPKELMKDEIQIAFKAISEGVQSVYLYDASLVTYNEAAIHGVIIPSDVEHGTILPMPCFDLVGGKMNMEVIPDPGYGIGELALTCNGIPVAYELDGDYLSYTMPDGDVCVTASFVQTAERIFFENFETEESFPEDWTLIDRDEDGTGFHREPEVGLYCWYGGLVSRSNNLSEQDNWAITPAITLPETASFLSFYAVTGMDLGKICKEDHLMVFVGSEPTIDSMMPLSEDIGGCHGYEYYEYDLSEFAGETIYIAFRHYDSSDQWSVNIDDIAVYASLEVERDPVIMAYVKGALDGKLGIAFFVDLPDWITSDEGAYVTLTQCGETKVKALSEIVQNGVNEDGYYRIATYMPAAYYRDNVTMRFYDGNDRLAKIIGKSSQTDLTAIGVNYTLLKYVNSMKNNSDSKIKKLGLAMDDYCTAAQIYFERNTTGETLTLSDAVSGVTQSELEGFKAVRNGTLPSSITGVTLKASFEADNTLKLGLNFKNNKKPSGVKYYISEDGTFENAVATTVRGNATSGYYLAVRNIPAAYLGKSYTFFIVNEKDTSSNNTYSISCSLFTYARATAFNSTYSENLRNLTKAMYLYGKAAANYFGVTQ